MSDQPSSMRWPIGIMVFFAILFVMNGTLIYLAVNNPDEVVPSYDAEHR